MAEVQSITFNEYVTATTGRPLPPYAGYNASLNAGTFFLTTNESLSEIATSEYECGSCTEGFHSNKSFY